MRVLARLLLSLVCSHIGDNKYAVIDGLQFHFDKEKARKILDDAKPIAPAIVSLEATKRYLKFFIIKIGRNL